MLMSLPARYWLKRRTMPGWSLPKAVIDEPVGRLAGGAALGGQRAAGPAPGRRAGRLRPRGPARPAAPASIGSRQADDHDQREVPAQHGLAARVDVAAQRLDGVGHRRHDARMVVGHHVQHVDVGESAASGAAYRTPGASRQPSRFAVRQRPRLKNLHAGGGTRRVLRGPLPQRRQRSARPRPPGRNARR